MTLAGIYLRRERTDVFEGTKVASDPEPIQETVRLRLDTSHRYQSPGQGLPDFLETEDSVSESESELPTPPQQQGQLHEPTPSCFVPPELPTPPQQAGQPTPACFTLPELPTPPQLPGQFISSCFIPPELPLPPQLPGQPTQIEIEFRVVVYNIKNRKLVESHSGRANVFSIMISSFIYLSKTIFDIGGFKDFS